MWKWRYVHENYTDTLAICTVWWWSVVVVVVLCGSGGYIYIYVIVKCRPRGVYGI